MPSTETVFIGGITLYMIYWIYITLQQWLKRWMSRHKKDPSTPNSVDLSEAFLGKKLRIQFPMDRAKITLYRRDTMDSTVYDNARRLLKPFLDPGLRIAEFTVIRVAHAVWGTLYSMHLFVYEGDLTYRARVEILQLNDGSMFLNDYILEKPI